MAALDQQQGSFLAIPFVLIFNLLLVPQDKDIYQLPQADHKQPDNQGKVDLPYPLFELRAEELQAIGGKIQDDDAKQPAQVGFDGIEVDFIVGRAGSPGNYFEYPKNSSRDKRQGQEHQQ